MLFGAIILTAKDLEDVNRGLFEGTIQAFAL
jgi:hypothetical protein